MAQGSEGTEAGEEGASSADFPSLSPFGGVGVVLVCVPGIIMFYM